MKLLRLYDGVYTPGALTYSEGTTYHWVDMLLGVAYRQYGMLDLHNSLQTPLQDNVNTCLRHLIESSVRNVIAQGLGEEALYGDN